MKYNIINIIIITIHLVILISCEHKQKTKPIASTKLEDQDIESPFLKSPKVKKIWQEDKIEGRKYIKGHWIYEIEEQPVWMK